MICVYFVPTKTKKLDKYSVDTGWIECITFVKELS
jgi:hypothetical protein